MAEDLAGLGYWWMDAATQTIHWSRNMYRIFGFDPSNPPALDEAMSRVHPEDRQQSYQRLAQNISGATDLSLTRILLPSGEVRFIEGRNGCEYGPEGDVVAVYGTLLDVTERILTQRALAESERRYRLLAENATDVTFCFNPQGEISFVSPSVSELLGWAPSDVIGRNWTDFMHPDDQGRARAALNDNSSRGPGAEPIRIVYRSQAKDGQLRYLESHCRAIFDAAGRVVEFQDVVRDVSAREAARKSLTAAKRDAEKASAIKAEFLSNMSHELRTPLTAIIGFSDMLAEAKSVDETRDFARQVRHASAALLSLVNGLLDFSRLEAGRFTLKPQPVSPSDIARQCLDLVRAAACAKALSVEFVEEAAVPDRVLIDCDAYRQVLINLLGNAVKFTDQGSVRLCLGYDREAALLHLKIEDSGAGIPPDQMSKLFQRFSQIDGSASRLHGGAGLGLAICKGLVEAMGGSIRAKSALGEGSTFSFAVPAPPTDAIAGNTGVSVRPVSGARVLVADDNPSNRLLIRRMLESCGADVTCASDGQTALAAAFGTPFDLILLDVRMPEMSGAEVALAIRMHRGPNKNAPLIAFTASGPGLGGQAAKYAEFDDVLFKPASASDVLALVAKHVGIEEQAA